MVRSTLLVGLLATSLGTLVSAQRGTLSGTSSGLLGGLLGLGGLSSQWSCDETTGIKSRIVQTTNRRGQTTTTTESAPCDPVPCTVYPRTSDPGNYGACVEESDGWFKYKVLSIQVESKYGGYCPTAQQRTIRDPCPPVPCVLKTPAQDTGSFGACQDDGGDVWYKHKFLGTQTPALYGGSCPGPQDPSRDYRELCPAVPCVVKTPAQDTGSFGACQDDGGDVWYKHKFLGTQTPAQYGGSCPGPQDPSRDYRELCPAVACVVKTPAQDTGSFGACQDDGGDVWYMHKYLGTQTPAQYGGSCPGPQDPSRDYRELCPTVACVLKTPAQDTGSFGACQDDGGDVWYKHKFLGTQTPAQYGGSCPGPQDPARDYRELCPAVPCVVKTPAQDTDSFGACQDDGGDVWYKHKFLGTQTPAQYGGACPGPQDPARDYRELCPAVACVVKTPAQDTDSFGACRDDGGDVWYKHKFLGTQTPAQYGGSCPGPQDPSRDYRELCPAVDCVLKTSAQDTGSFAACQDDGGDVWYKHKFLGTQTAAQYGGSCPGPQDPARDYRELCPAVPCVVKTSSQDTGSFGACQDDGGDVWYKHKFLGTQTPAQYGGSCPGQQDSSRDYRELCLAVPCVLTTPAQDTGSFGACENVNGGWSKLKYLGTQTAAQYGGACPGPQDPSREYREVCPAVACVVKTPAEDTGAFGACQQEATGWFKYKTLGIKTPALYGGSCPSESDRRYRAPCVRTCRSLAPGRGIGAASYFETITTTTSAACCDLCRQRPRCESYVFYTHNRQCWIQSAQRTLFASATAIGGTISSA